MDEVLHELAIASWFRDGGASDDRGCVQEPADEADEEVERVMTELAADNFKTAESAPTRQPVVAAEEKAAAEDDDEEDMGAMRERLAQLRS